MTSTDRRQPEPRIGVVGADVPRQLVLACGAVPLRIFGSWTGGVSREASELLGAADVVAARVLDGILSDAQKRPLAYDGLVVCNDSLANLRLFYVLRMLADRGRLPFTVHLLDAPRGRSEHLQRFVARQYMRLTDMITGITGRPVDRSSLRDAADRESALGDALRVLRQRRLERTVSGTAALQAYQVAAQDTPEAAIKQVTALAGTPQAPPVLLGTAGPAARGAEAVGPAADPVPVYVTGSSHPDDSVYAALEEAGAIVVSEDHDAGDAAWIGASVDATSLEEACHALAGLHALRPPSAARSLSAERTQHMVAEVRRTEAVGVVALVRELDDGPAWDLTEQRRALAGTETWLADVVRVQSEGTRRAARQLAARIQSRQGTPIG